MPPQQTNISPGIGADAARRGLNLSIAQAKDAIDQALAARLKASATALNKNAAEANAASRRSVLGLLKQAWFAFLARRQNPRLTVHDLSDRELLDIGLTRGEVDYLSPQRAIDNLRDRTRYLWNRGGM
ncbi:DUF1127 domain-containing protein [Bradyrhizobium guangdongense]|uniref:YjiS-like domain-containing protein n=1 Tax=Bradyrhizobium guangdongense TaxID=1325090 RepID=A0A410V4V3_9BRAD|nr:DUF1127 domain-containing protein [Bradyrhizobium guangdongense]QAU38684.1 hypothetical protein X265_14135 [Bradyrhizobium guangdongense]QOZ59742.1 hypothetical protein XH86_14140 [Bradyrhizobium guangdongense]GGI29345.1 hypothetical protein GCM10010987_53950 [Bradyrhizobium guangdongense]